MRSPHRRRLWLVAARHRSSLRSSKKKRIVEKLVTAAPTKPAQASFNWVYIANALGAVASVSTIASSNAGREKGVISKRIHEVDVCEL